MHFLCCLMYFCIVLCIVYFVSFSVLSVCICLLNYRHRVATQLQLKYIISYIIIPSTAEIMIHECEFKQRSPKVQQILPGTLCIETPCIK
jgi:hypothetical protein